MQNNWLTITKEGNDVILDSCSKEAEGEIVIPDGVTKIGLRAFSGCSGLTSVTIPSSVTSIDEFAFSGCSGLTSVTFNAANCNDMGSSRYPVFSGCTNLTTVTIGENVTKIPAYAFADCRGLTSITIPSSVTSIGQSAFDGCSGLTSVTIPSSVTSIGNYAFYGCSGLTSVTFNAANCNAMGSSPFSVFSGCTNLTTVTIGENVTKIPAYAFADCSGLTSVTIPSSVTSIGDFAFADCSGLTSVTFNAANCNDMGSLGLPVFSGCTNLTTVTIGENVTKIPVLAFADCSGLTSVTIPSSVTSIGNSAFDGCSGLTSVTFNAANCNDMGWSEAYPVFRGCTNLTMVTIGENVTKIPAYAFAGCSGLTSVTIPSSVTSIGECAFYGCSFKKLLFEGNLPEDKDGIFSNCKIEELWVNTPRKKTVISNGLQNAIEQSDGRVIYAIPALCEEDSKIPGYIKATLVNNDELIDINTKYILSVEPYELKDKYEKYQPHTGTLMTCASNGIERRCQILVYEPHEMVVHKIAKSLTMLSQQVGGIAGLLNQIDTLFKYKMK